MDTEVPHQMLTKTGKKKQYVSEGRRGSISPKTKIHIRLPDTLLSTIPPAGESLINISLVES
jgi:hypothetical protein